MKQFRLLAILFIITKATNTIIAYIAHLYDPYPRHLAYHFKLYHYNPYIPPFLIDFANYDGANYLHIAHDGYGAYMQAYFPLYPFLIRLLSGLFGHGFFLTGFFISNCSFLFALYFFQKYLESIMIKKSYIIWTLVLLLSYPMSFFLGAVYTESLFFLLVSATLYFSQKRNYTLVVVCGMLSALTRLMGVFLIIPLVATLVFQDSKFSLNQKTPRKKIDYIVAIIKKRWKLVIVSLSPILGLCSYMLYLYFTAHDAFLFYHAVAGFHTGRTATHLILLPQVYFRYFAIFFKASHTFVYYIAILEFLTFNFFLVILLYDLWQLWRNKKVPAVTSLIGLNCFSLINLILPTVTGTLTSLPRYAIFSFSCFLRLSMIQNWKIKGGLLFLFVMLHILLLTLFIQGYFVS